MKNIFILFIILLLSLEITFCDDSGGTLCIGSSSSIDKCKELLSNEEKSNKDHCCLFTGYLRDSYESQCLFLDNDEYNDINSEKTYYIDNGYKDVKIECNSYYYSLNIVFCILFILL